MYTHTHTRTHVQELVENGKQRYVRTDFYTMQNTTTALYYTALHCIELQHTATHIHTYFQEFVGNRKQRYVQTHVWAAIHCNRLQQTATHPLHCNTLQHTVTQ